jgi:NADH-quinone oxidoreductase subunit N
MISFPDIDYAGLSPLLITVGGALLAVLVAAFWPERSRWWTQVALTALTLVAALVAVVVVAERRTDDAGLAAGLTAGGAVAVDGPALFLQGAVAVLGLIGVILMAEKRVDPSGGGAFSPAPALPVGSRDDRKAVASATSLSDMFPITLFALSGMMLMTAANNLLLMFVALELLSLPLYLMAGMSRRRRLASQESAIKYFLLGAFASAFFAYGIALLYGYGGTVNLSELRETTTGSEAGQVLLLVGAGLLTVGLLFKVAAVPFHSWTPDVYQGAPTSVTALMAAVTKVAAFGALLRVYYVAFIGLEWNWQPVLGVVAAVTMMIGSILAITQTDLKRMLAYSSVAQAGFILVAVTAGTPGGLAATLFYVVVYGLAVIGAFAVVTLIRDGEGEATHLSRWAGLGQRSPLLAGLLAVFLFAFTGIPLTSGFIAKLTAFGAGISADLTWLVIVGVVASAIAAFFYLRVVVLMFFTSAAGDPPAIALPGIMTSLTVGVTAAATILIGVWPEPLLDLVQRVGVFVG